MIVRAIKTAIFREKDDLLLFIRKYVPKLKDGSILVVTSKVVALSEGRTAIAKTGEAKRKLIQKESQWMKKSELVYLTLKDGMLLPNAGVDESNADGKIVLLPKDSYAVAAALRAKLKKHYGIKRLGIVISDSRVMMMRKGVLGVSLGHAGFKGIKDYRGKRDIFGRKLKITWQNMPDAIATAAALCMGEGNERQPLAIIEDAPVVFTEKVNRRELVIAPKQDMYSSILRLPH